MHLNEEQERAVRFKDGPAVVLAGPGSGKTAVITGRTIKLIREDKVPAGNILVVTFTRAAAEEMKRRVYKETVNDAEKQVSFGTFHSIFFKILRFARNFDSSCVAREKDVMRFLTAEASALGMEYEGMERIAEIRGEIGKVKGNGGLKENYVPMSCDPKSFGEMYKKYEDMLKKSGLVDFEDMLIMTEDILNGCPEVLRVWQEKFKYIMVDEFQDINRLQYKLIRLLSEPENNLFIVGDDDQAIYGFRGSDPAIMLGFEKDYPAAEKIILSRNYRSKKNIVTVARNLIRHNSDRFDKKIDAVREEGTKPDIRCFADRKEENENIVSLIREYRARGLTWSQIAIIHRTNRFAWQTASFLTAAGIPYAIKGGVGSIYSHFAVTDVLSYIKAALGDRKRETFLNIINRPKRYISRSVMVDPVFSFERVRAELHGYKSCIASLDRLEYDLSYLKRGTPTSAVMYVRRAVGYDDFLKEYAAQQGVRPDEFMSVLDAFMEEASLFDDFNDWFEHISKMKNELERRRDLEDVGTPDAVTVTTMHGSKGLEYDVVFIPDANEGITPYQRAVSKHEEEQERRMFYVAVTRAAVNLHVFSVKKLSGKDTAVSRFVKEMLDFS